MADSIRQQIVDAVVVRLQTILITGSYETDAGSNVEVWLNRPWTAAELPGINVRDTDIVITRTHQLDIHEMNLELDLYTAVGDAPNTMRKLMADVITAFGTDKTFGGLAIDIEQGAELFQLEQNENVIAGVQMIFTLQFETDHFDPYN